MRRLAVALVHYPILARDQSVVTTSITNLDIHDIARSTFTYGVEAYFLVHPIEAQRQLVSRVQEHWTTGSGATRIPDRRPPMERVRVVASVEDARQQWSAPIEGQEGTLSAGQTNSETQAAEVWVTSAQPIPGAISHPAAHELLHSDGPPVLLLFGTGWGLAPEVIASAQRSLAPIESPRPDGYNHLSVRAAAAILLDRLVVGGR